MTLSEMLKLSHSNIVGFDSGDKEVVLSPKFLGTLVAGFVVLFVLFKEAYKTSVPRIQSLPEAPHGLPFVGHMLSLGGRQKQNDSTIYSRWATRLSSDIFQCRIGSQRTVVVGSWSMAKDLWVGHANELIDRPPQPDFVDKLGVDVSGSPMTDRIRRCRQAAMRALGKPKWPGYYRFLEPTSVDLVRAALLNGDGGRSPMDIYPYIRRVAFDLILSLTYGARFGEVDNKFTLGLLDAISEIASIRASTTTFRHYIPLLRIIPERKSRTMAAERKRQAHIDVLYNSYMERVAKGEALDCIVAALNEDKLTEDEIHGTCISLLGAASDTVSSGIYQCLAWLCSSEGQSTQESIRARILQVYDGDADMAWKMAFREEKVPEVVSLYKETLRYFSFTPFAAPRQTSSSFEYCGIQIPKGVTMILNAQQANHDTHHYGDDAMEFNPARFIGNDTSLPHFTFGAGSRVCAAFAISNRIMNGMLTRLILSFKMRESKTRKPNIDMINFSDVYGSIVAQPRAFDCCFFPRDSGWLQQLTNEGGET